MGNVFFVAIGEIALVLILKEVGNVVIDFFLLSAVFEAEFDFFFTFAQSVGCRLHANWILGWEEFSFRSTWRDNLGIRCRL